MNTTLDGSDRTGAIPTFLDALEPYFDDVEPRERADLLEDLEAHLRELEAEGDDELATILADPAAYADELRRSVGLSGSGATSAGRGARLGAWLRARPAAVTRHPWGAALVGFLPELRPAWWVVRGWVAVTALALVLNGGPIWRHVPVPWRHPLGLVLGIAAVVVSVRAGRSGVDRSRAGRVANGALGVAAVVLGLGLLGGPPVEFVEVPHAVGADAFGEPPVLRHPDGEPITNLHLFDVEGRALTQVLVYDGAGRPVEIGDLAALGWDDIETDYPRDRRGTQVRNLYPLQQFVSPQEPPGTGTGTGVATRVPRAAPEVSIPPLPVPDAVDGATGTTTGPTAAPTAGADPTVDPTADPTNGPTTAPEPTGRARPGPTTAPSPDSATGGVRAPGSARDATPGAAGTTSAVRERPDDRQPPG